MHQSDRELFEALRNRPQLINQANVLAQTPLHLAVGWPQGVRELLQHGACVNSTDNEGFTPIYYAVYLGFSETVGLLMKAGCNLEVNHGYWSKNLLWHVSQYWGHNGVWGVSREARMDVLDTAIFSLAERRRGLQSRFADLPMAARIKAGVFRDDRILDEHAKFAELAEEDALEGCDHLPLRASTLLAGCRTVYHISTLTVTFAEKLWQNGFRDIDVLDVDGRTPLMLCRDGGWVGLTDIVTEIEICSWLIQKGAKLHRPQHSPLDYDPDRILDPLELPPTTRALHHVANSIGYIAGIRVNAEFYRSAKYSLLKLSKDARLLAATIFSDVSCDDCICACSSRGCMASTMMLKSFWGLVSIGNWARPKWSLLGIEYLLHLVGPQDSCWEWLGTEIVRLRTFQELELRHTCCRCEGWDTLLTKLDSEEIVEIRDEDHEKIELLESLLPEFEENRGDQDLLSFLKGYWVTRMDQVLQKKGKVNEEALREMGVVLHQEETEDFDRVEGLGESGSDDGLEEIDSDDGLEEN